jgi:threonine/homoserine/homoserine lactone efflux protein
MALGTAAAFWAVSFLFVITPGADWAYAISAGVRNRTVLPAVGGLLAGHVLATIVVAAGVAAVVAGSPMVLTALTLTGAAYLVWLGAGMLTGPAAAPAVDEGSESGSWLRQAATGLGISGLNPKVFLLFLALLPQFIDTDGAWPVAAQIVTLGLLHVASCAVIYTAVGTGARSVLRTRPAAARRVTRFSGAAMVVIGAVLIIEQLVA